MVKVGESAPDFSLPAHDGRTISLASLKGRKVLLWFYPQADTPGCTAEGRAFRDQQAYFDENNIQVLGASFDSLEANAAFAQKNAFTFPLLSDLDGKVGLAYGASSDPKAKWPNRVSFLIDEAGKIARVYDQVDARNHPGQVLADVLDAQS